MKLKKIEYYAPYRNKVGFYFKKVQGYEYKNGIVFRYICGGVTIDDLDTGINIGTASNMKDAYREYKTLRTLINKKRETEEYKLCVAALEGYRKEINIEKKIEHRITELKTSSDYPHNFKGQMVEDLEWVLGLFNQGTGGTCEKVCNR